ncbi:MAG: hypothetical protein ACYC4S_18340 [Rhodoferax sp.]
MRASPSLGGTRPRVCPAMLDAIHTMVGPSIIAAGIRVGVQSDCTVSYMNPDYWYRAYLRGPLKTAQTPAKALQARLATALDSFIAVGGIVAGAVATMRYQNGRA